MSREVDQETPLCVDLDGTLIRSDLLLESMIVLFRNFPFTLFLLPFWLLRGRSHLKRQIARRVELNVATLPYNGEVLEFLREERVQGRTLVLVTASDSRYANHVAQHLDLFSEVIASDGISNLKGVDKRKRLDALYRKGRYDYIGDSKADVEVWQGTKKALLVGDLNKRSELERTGIVFDRVFSESFQDHRCTIWFRALRIHQWAKNSLIFVPLLLAHRFGEVESWILAGVAFLTFSLVASASYILNDLIDLDFDRQHPDKRNRPLASGRLPLGHGIAVVPLLLVAALVLLRELPPSFTVCVASYMMITVLYSVVLKRLVILDVMVLAMLYTIRIIAGALAVQTPLTFWLLVFSMFLFLSLAFLKRCAELKSLQFINMKLNGRGVVLGRGYQVEDLAIIRSMGTSSGLLSVLVFALYINSSETLVLYQTPEILWFAILILLFWINRLWVLTHRGLMHTDPILFALQDKISLLSGALLMLFLWLATVGI